MGWIAGSCIAETLCCSSQPKYAPILTNDEHFRARIIEPQPATRSTLTGSQSFLHGREDYASDVEEDCGYGYIEGR
jgi:hypothetical protein